MRNVLFLILSLFLLSGNVAVAQDAPVEPSPVETVEEDADKPTADATPKSDLDKHAEGHEDGLEHATEEPTAPTTDDEAVKAMISLIDALKGQQWILAIGLFLALLVYGVNRFALKEKVSPKIVPWISFAVAVAGSVSAGLFSGTPALDAISAGLIAGSVAVGGWEAIMKNILKPLGIETKKSDAPEEAPTDPAASEDSKKED